MAGKVKALAAKPGDIEFDLWDPYGGRREPSSSTDCPLSSLQVPHGTCLSVSLCLALSASSFLRPADLTVLVLLQGLYPTVLVR